MKAGEWGQGAGLPGAAGAALTYLVPQAQGPLRASQQRDMGWNAVSLTDTDMHCNLETKR